MKNERYVLIDYTRAACVVLVILNHTSIVNSTIMNREGLPFFLFVNMAVPVFMILSGWSFAISSGDRIIKENYSFCMLGKRFLKITIPTLITYILYMAFKFAHGDFMSFKSIIGCFLCGGYGMGAYYYGLLVQLIFLLPVIWHLVKKYGANGVLMVAVCNFFYELFCTYFGIEEYLFRLLVFRYMFAVSMGMYIYRCQKISTRVLSEMFVVGIVYMLLPVLYGYHNRIFTSETWSPTSMMSIFYIFPIIYILRELMGGGNIRESNTTDNICSRGVCMVGRASYHIMYTQMIFFWIRPFIDKNIIDITSLPKIVECAINLFFSIITGLLFMQIERKIFGKLYRIRRYK